MDETNSLNTSTNNFKKLNWREYILIILQSSEKLLYIRI